VGFGCQRWGNNAAMSLALCVGKRVRMSLRYACGSCPLSCAERSRLMIAAPRCPARSEPANSQLARLCQCRHNRAYVHFAIMLIKYGKPPIVEAPTMYD
jgi:hypothetical protein